MSANSITTVTGRGIPLRGNDIDTDRIMPARYLRVVSFEGLEQHLFEDDRKTNRAQHPFSDLRYKGANILIVNENFGCGSSREHAPQGLARAGIRVIVGESFSEIFLGNSAILGIPCFAGEHAAIDQLQTLIEQSPETIVTADVESGIVTAGSVQLTAAVHPAFRDAFLSGQWNPTALLLDHFEDVRSTAGHLPYISGF